MADAFPLSGQVDPQAFPFLLMALHRQGATGSLKVAGPSYQKALYFRSGRILFGSSNDPRDQLGSILIESGVLTPEQLEDANSKVGPGSPLAKVLADTGFVSQRELSEAARAKVERILSDVIAYTSGSFEFEDGVLPKGAVDLKLPTERLLLSAVRRVEDRAFVLRHLSGLDVVLRPAPDMSGRLPEVEAETGELLAQIDGTRTLKEAAAATRLDEFEAAKVACALLFLGVVGRDGMSTGPGPAASTEGGAFLFPSDDGAEIDLSETAREAFGADGAPAPNRTERAEPARARSKTPPPRPADKADDDPFYIAPPPGEAAEALSAGPPPVKLPPLMTPPPPATPVAAGETAPAAAAAADTVRSRVDRGLRRPTPPIDAEPGPIDSVVLTAPDPVRPSPPRVAPAVTAPSMTPPSVTPPKIASTDAPAGAPRPSLPPDWRPSSAPPAAARPAPREEPATASRPSKDDLAALDALLNSRGLEGPLEPMERKAPDAQRWSPQFGAPARSARHAPARSPIMMVGALLALAAVGVAGGWYLRQRSRSTSIGVASASPAPAPITPSTTLPPVASTAAAASVVPPVALPSPRAVAASPATAPLPRPTPAFPSPATVRPVGSTGGLDQARGLMNRGDFDGAARSFASSVRSAPTGTLSIQLLVACSAETVQKAVSNASSPELYILPVSLKGRDCYRLCWGLYPGEARANDGLRSVPDYFRKNGASPRVTPAGQLLP